MTEIKKQVMLKSSCSASIQPCFIRFRTKAFRHIVTLDALAIQIPNKNPPKDEARRAGPPKDEARRAGVSE